jgi:endo-1,4-beta-D-glucanase Y
LHRLRRSAAVVALIGVTATSGACTLADAAANGPALAAARADANAFLQRYVQPDGRVARLDQGGDTVSEGQSYGLLLAEVAGATGLVRTIWGWTRDHLQRDDGLLAYHASPQGAVLDRSSATDADLVTA